MAAIKGTPVYLYDPATGLFITTAQLSGVVQGTWTDKAGTVATGGIAVTAIAANLARKGFYVTNPSSATESLWINFTTAAVVGSTSSLEIPPGATYYGNPVTTEAISANAATSAHPFGAKEFA